MAAQIRPPTLDYRFGVPGGERVEHALRELMSSESMGIAVAATKLAAGVPLCLAGPFLVTCMLWTRGIDFGMTFLVLSCIAVPALMWLERRTEGQFLWRALDSITPRATPAADSWTNREIERDVCGRSNLALLELEFALFGPRLIWSVIDWLREKRPVEPAIRVLAAEISVELFDAKNSRRLAELVRPGRSPAEIIQAANYLVRCQWADLYRSSLRLRLRDFVRRRWETKV